MKAEIGFALDDNWRPTERLQLTITPQSSPEVTTTKVVAKRMGLVYSECDGELVIREPERAP